MSLLPSFLTSTLSAPASALGLIEGISDALAGLARFGGGALADDPSRRRRVAVGGYATTAVLSSAIGVAAAPWQAGGLPLPARNALLVDLVPAEAYGRAYWFERAMDNLRHRWAAAGDRADRGGEHPDSHFLSMIPGLLSAVAIVYAIRHTATAKQRHHQPIRIKVRPVLHGGLGGW